MTVSLLLTYWHSQECFRNFYGVGRTFCQTKWSKYGFVHLKRYTDHTLMNQGRCDWLLITNQPIPIGPLAKTIVYLHIRLHIMHIHNHCNAYEEQRKQHLARLTNDCTLQEKRILRRRKICETSSCAIVHKRRVAQCISIRRSQVQLDLTN